MNNFSLFAEPPQGPFCDSTPLADCGCHHTARPGMIYAVPPAPPDPPEETDEPLVPKQMPGGLCEKDTRGQLTIPATQPGPDAPEATLEPDAAYQYIDNEYGEVSACWINVEETDCAALAEELEFEPVPVPYTRPPMETVVRDDSPAAPAPATYTRPPMETVVRDDSPAAPAPATYTRPPMETVVRDDSPAAPAPATYTRPPMETVVRDDSPAVPAPATYTRPPMETVVRDDSPAAPAPATYTRPPMETVLRDDSPAVPAPQAVEKPKPLFQPAAESRPAPEPVRVQPNSEPAPTRSMFTVSQTQSAPPSGFSSQNHRSPETPAPTPSPRREVWRLG